MPRIYAPNEEHTIAWGAVDFVNGVSAVAADSDTSFFEAEGYGVDNSKHVVTVLDLLTRTQLEAICNYLGVSYTADDTKQEIVRALETSFSTKYLAAVVVASTAGAEDGTSDIAITGAGTYKYKTAATTAPALLFMAYPDDTWLDIETGDDITPTEGHDKITVVKLNAGGYVIGLGSDDITVKTGT